MGKYFKKILQSNNNYKQRIHIYNRGDECVDITGGWISSNLIEKRADRLFFPRQANTGTISTVNNITIGLRDRIGIIANKFPNTNAVYSVRVSVGIYSDSNNRPRRVSDKLQDVVASVINLTETQVMMYVDRALTSNFIFTGYYGDFEVHEVWIDRY